MSLHAPKCFHNFFYHWQLSTEDLGQCKSEMDSCFKGIREVKDKLYLPNVEDPVETLKVVAGIDQRVAHFLKNGSLNLPLDTLEYFVFVNFEANNSRETKSSAFAHHDWLITKLYNELSSQDRQTLFIYTGRRSVDRRRSIRSIPDPVQRNKTENSTGTVWSRDEFLLHYTDFRFVDDSRNQSITFDKVTSNDVSTGTNGIHVSVSMSVTETGDNFGFEMIENNGSWWFANAKWNDEELFLGRDISGIYNYSFHCSPTIELFTCNRTAVIGWTNLQIQPNFNVTIGNPLTRFNDAVDCVYFFTPGIMSGMFVGAILFTILAIAISCILDIHTNNRFDPVKSKFAINVFEE